MAERAATWGGGKRADSRGPVRERAGSGAGAGSRERAGSGRGSAGAAPPGLAMLGARGGCWALRRCASVPRAVRLRVCEALGAREPADAVRVQVGARPREDGGLEGKVGDAQRVLLCCQISSAAVQSLSVCCPAGRAQLAAVAAGEALESLGTAGEALSL